MASKIDVKIKVSSNIQVDSSSSSEQNTHRSSQEDDGKDENVQDKTNEDKIPVDIDGQEDQEGQSRTETFKTDGKSLKIHVTSEENLTLVKSGDEINITQNSNENLHLDIEDNSDDGDNSVFTEGALTPAEAAGPIDEVATGVGDNPTGKVYPFFIKILLIN